MTADRNIFHSLAGQLREENDEISKTALARIQYSQKFIIPDLAFMLDEKQLSGPAIALNDDLPFSIIALHYEYPDKVLGRHVDVISTVSRQDGDLVVASYWKQNDGHGWIAVPWFFAKFEDGQIQLKLKRGITDIENVRSKESLRVLGAFLILMSLQNVSHEEILPSEALNKKRAANGKVLLYSYHVLTIDGQRTSASERGSVTDIRLRSHYRRGHIRRLDETRRIWVRPTFVRGSARGFVDKDYRIGAAA